MDGKLDLLELPSDKEFRRSALILQGNPSLEELHLLVGRELM